MAFLLHHLVTEKARSQPGAEAVRFRGTSLSYAELDAASDAFAQTLARGGVGPRDRVALQLRKGIESWVAVWGILKAGAALVPIDPAAPPSRTAAILRDCSVAGIVGTPSQALAALAELGDGKPALAVLVGEESGPSGFPIPAVRYQDAVRELGAGAPDVHVIDLDLAIIWYTSGTTGTPKGAALSHRAVMTFAVELAGVMRAEPRDRVSGFTPLHFSLACLDLFPGLLGGAAVVLIPEETGIVAKSLERTIRDEGITIWCSVPSALRLLLQGGLAERPFPALRQVWFSGEVFPVKDLAELRRRLPDVEFINVYGGAETLGRMFHRVHDVPLDRPAVPVGKPFPNAQALVLRDDGTPAGVGDVGELYMRSSMLMHGYWADLEKTSRMLVPNPLGSHPADLVCVTGDLVRVLPDGRYEFVSRKDDQIKKRGVRIELAEIDAALNSHPDVEEGAAVALQDEVAGTVIAAGVVAKAGRRLSEAIIARHLRELLPPSMAPSYIAFVDHLPRNSSGKVDRRGLGQSLSEAVGNLKPIP